MNELRIFVIAFLIFPCAAGASDLVGGRVVLDHYECLIYDRIVIETRRGFTNGQVYSGYDATVEGRIIFGDLNSYGMTDIYDKDGDKVGRIYVDDYLVGSETAAAWCVGED